MSQERNILITNKGIYNLKKKGKKLKFLIFKELKRRFEISSIRGITIAKPTDEFVIHGNDVEYDYNYVSSRKKKIVEIISISYKDQTSKDFKLCELDSKSLKNMVTSKKEKKKDVNFSRMPVTNLINIATYINGNQSNKTSSVSLNTGNNIYAQQGTVSSKLK